MHVTLLDKFSSLSYVETILVIVVTSATLSMPLACPSHRDDVSMNAHVTLSGSHLLVDACTYMAFNMARDRLLDPKDRKSRMYS